MKKKTVAQIYGKDADLMEEGWSVPPTMIRRSLCKLELCPQQQCMLRIMLDYRFSLQGVIPSLRQIAKEMLLGYRQAQRWLKSLLDLDLVCVKGGKGKRYTFDLSPLFNAVRDLLRHKRRKPEPESESAVPEADPDFMYQPLNPEQQELAEELAEANWPESDMAEWGYMPGWRHLDSMSSWRQVLHVFDSEQVRAIRRWLSRIRRGLVLMVAALPGG